MTRRSAITGTLLGLALLLSTANTGCAQTRPFFPRRKAPKPPPATVPEDPPVRRNPIVQAAHQEPAEPQSARRPRNVLALSGGGSYGAFTAGVLTGWTRTDKRPEFDVVTGVSTGALIAPFAFLGPKYDPDLKKAYTELRHKDVFALRAVATIPFRDAVASSAGLRKMVEAGMTDAVVAALAAEHRKGRRLYVSTTQLNTRKTVVWDLGGIAVQGGDRARRLICDVLVASCAIPGVFPPVPIASEAGRPELHVDGGVTATIFVPAQVLSAAKAKPGDAPANLYVIVAGKYFSEVAPVRPRLIGVLKASGGAMLRANYRKDVTNLYLSSKLAGVAFHSLALRQDFEIEETSIDFDQATMHKLYVEGVKAGVAGPAWDTTPPDGGPGEPDDIRTGPRWRGDRD
ncbi:MAG TPA: patatin-like phospholipase family protein [Fimbriiglobus sp.]|nr:patatin-like phospholipase family protein [Fimbriiglobus sp.]